MNYEIKITGSGTQEELVAALRVIADNIMMAGSGNPQGLTNELDDVEWEDATLITKITEAE